jgi:AAA domain-containing protein
MSEENDFERAAERTAEERAAAKGPPTIVWMPHFDARQPRPVRLPLNPDEGWRADPEWHRPRNSSGRGQHLEPPPFDLQAFGEEGDPGAQPAPPRANGKAPRRGVKVPPMPREPLFRSWEVIDPAALPPRDFIYAWHYIRGFASVTLAPGGGSKSGLVMVESVACATGRALLGVQPKQRERTVYFNAEDPRDEIDRRVLAICQHFEIPQQELVDWLFTESGRDQDITLAYGIDGEINEPVFEMMQRFGDTYGPGVMSFDPLAAMTESPETNEVFRAVGRRVSKLADRMNCAIGLAHHMRKLGGREAEIEDSRGGIALIDTARAARVLNPMTKDEATHAQLDTHLDHFRVDDGKANLARRSELTEWYRRISVPLPNGDNVAVVERWKWPDPFEGVSTADALRVQRAIAACADPPRENIQAEAWAGKIVAAALGLNIDKRGERERIKAMLRTWVEADVLRIERVKDKRRDREISVVAVGANRLDEADD